MAKLAYNFARVAWLQAGSRSPEPSDFHKAGVSDIDHGERNTANLNGSTPRAKPKARAARNSVFSKFQLLEIRLQLVRDCG